MQSGNVYPAQQASLQQCPLQQCPQHTVLFNCEIARPGLGNGSGTSCDDNLCLGIWSRTSGGCSGGNGTCHGHAYWDGHLEMNTTSNTCLHRQMFSSTSAVVSTIIITISLSVPVLHHNITDHGTTQLHRVKLTLGAAGSLGPRAHSTTIRAPLKSLPCSPLSASCRREACSYTHVPILHLHSMLQ